MRPGRAPDAEARTREEESGGAEPSCPGGSAPAPRPPPPTPSCQVVPGPQLEKGHLSPPPARGMHRAGNGATGLEPCGPGMSPDPH